MRVTLLGTGIPAPDLLRRGASQVIEVGDQLVMVDCGRGALDRFVEAGHVQANGRVLTRPLHTLALTHLHSDHITGIPDLLWAGWVMRWRARMPTPNSWCSAVLLGVGGSPEDILHDVATTYAGRATVASDLQVFTTTG